MRPQPIEATLIKLPGAFFPNTVAGRMVGKFIATADPNVAVTESCKNFLRLITRLFVFMLTIVEFDFFGALLSFKRKFGRQEAMMLRHGGFCAV